MLRLLFRVRRRPLSGAAALLPRTPVPALFAGNTKQISTEKTAANAIIMHYLLVCATFSAFNSVVFALSCGLRTGDQRPGWRILSLLQVRKTREKSNKFGRNRVK